MLNIILTIVIVGIGIIALFLEGLDENPEKKKGFRMLCITIGMFLLILLVWSWVIVPAGQTGVYHLFGKVKEQPLSSGFHFKNPLAKVTLMSIRTEEYTMSIAEKEGEKKGNDSIDALTKEGLKITLDLTVLYRLDEKAAPRVYKELGTNYVDKLIRPQVRASIREVVSEYTAKDIYSEKRQEIQQAIYDRINSTIAPRGIILEKVLLRNVILPPKLTNSIEQKLQAEQEAQRMSFVLEKEKKEAERKAIEAQGIRTAQETIQKTLTPAYLRWYSLEMMKTLANSPNSTFLFVPIDENGMPIINVYPGNR